ncbi:pitrilysin family protein [Thioalkalivibrio sp. ALJ24]|uniref:M16 family metallopeptidase n=1 Tax=Thioalkalivibrio sp. ALJ24 TaxID=545276 RepID=UPI00037561B4|nr:pitrilysin family protein [Thioalkalivibrio sp. ALJ24]
MRWTGVLLAVLFAAPAAAMEIERWETDEGLQVLFVEAPDLPMVDLRLTFDAGAARDEELPGLARMTSRGLRHGTAGMDADELAERFESVGARFSTRSQRDMAVVTLRSLTEEDWLDTAMETLTAVLAEPAFPEGDFERARRQALQGLQRERQEPGSMASRRFHELAYAGHPYASWPSGTRDSLEAMTRDDAQAFFERYYTTGNAVLAMTGGIDREQAEGLAARVSQALRPGEAAPALPPVPRLEEPVTEHVPFPSEQAHIRIGAPALQRGDDAYYPLTLGNHVLGGGGFTSRLFRELRSERGLAYSVRSAFQPRAAEGPFSVSMQTGTEQTAEAVEALHVQIGRWHAEGVQGAELEASRANVINGFPLRLESSAGIVSHLALIGFYDLDPDYLSAYPARMDAVTLEDVQHAVRERVDPQALVTVIVGGEEP